LRQIAANYRAKHLDSNDKDDKTDIWDKQWVDVERDSAKAEALGGPYIGVHLRRKDFLYARKELMKNIYIFRYSGVRIAHQLITHQHMIFLFNFAHF